MESNFLELYTSEKFSMTPVETWLSWTAEIHFIVNYHKKIISSKGNTSVAYSSDLYKVISKLVSCFFDEPLTIPEAF